MKKKEHAALTQPRADGLSYDVRSAASGEGASELSGTERGSTTEKTVSSDYQHTENETAVQPGIEEHPVAGDAVPASEGDAPPKTSSVRRTAGRSGMLPLVIATVALLLSLLTLWQTWAARNHSNNTYNNVRQELAERLAAADGAGAEMREHLRQQQESTAMVQRKVGALESEVEKSSGQAAALESLYQELFRSRSDRILAEAEQAINIAAQQLQVAGNVNAALIALQGAEARLAQSDQGYLQPLRRALRADISELSTRRSADISGMALQLEILLERVDKLPLAHAVTFEEQQDVPSAAAEGYALDYRQPMVFLKALGKDAWGEIRSLVRIDDLSDGDPVLLAPKQASFLRENVKIRLLTARLALLARDGRTFSADLQQTHAWIEKYFDRNDPQVQQVIRELQELEAVDVKPDPFMLTESLAALRLLQSRPQPAMPVGQDGSASLNESR